MQIEAKDTGEHAEHTQDQTQSRMRTVREEQSDTPNAYQNKPPKTEHQAEVQTGRCNALTILAHMLAINQ